MRNKSYAYGMFCHYIITYQSIIPLAFGGDLNIIPGGEKIYFGFTRSGGFGTPGKEIHIEKIETVSCIQSQINIFDLFGRVYDSIMEW